MEKVEASSVVERPREQELANKHEVHPHKRGNTEALWSNSIYEDEKQTDRKHGIIYQIPTEEINLW